jgi:DNA-binding MarR family transcriptional regulator
MQLFAALKKIREFERLRLPFLNSLIDFDIIIEIGYAEEGNRPLTPKQLYLLALGSHTTVRRRLGALVERGVISQHINVQDRRSANLRLTPKSSRVLRQYGRLLTAVSVFPA